MITIMTLHLEILSRIIVLQRKLKLELHSRQSRVDKTADYQSIQMMKSIFEITTLKFIWTSSFIQIWLMRS